VVEECVKKYVIMANSEALMRVKGRYINHHVEDRSLEVSHERLGNKVHGVK